MRILHVTDRLSARGGADWHLLGVLQQLCAAHEARLVVGRDDGSATAPCSVERVEGLDDPRCGTGRSSVRAALDRCATSFGPDVIHIHNALGPEPLEWAADHGAVMTVQDHRCFCPGRGKLTLTGEPCGVVMSEDHCRPCFEDASYFADILALTRRRLAAVRRMRALTVLSVYMKQELLAASGLSAERVLVIRPLVWGLDRDATPDGPACALFAGRLARAKGVWDAAAAWRRSGVSLPLVFVGTGPERAALERRGFEVLGWVAHDRLSRVYRRARALLLPSRWQEPFGIVGPEALGLGVPVMAWRSGGVAEWHPGARGGSLVRWGDVDALGEALASRCADSAADQAIAPRCDFDTERLMGKLTTLYQSIP